MKVYNTISKLRCFRTALECLLFGIQNINYTDFPLFNMFHSQVFHLRNCIYSRTEQFMISMNFYFGFVFCSTKVNNLDIPVYMAVMIFFSYKLRKSNFDSIIEVMKIRHQLYNTNWHVGVRGP